MSTEERYVYTGKVEMGQKHRRRLASGLPRSDVLHGSLLRHRFTPFDMGTWEPYDSNNGPHAQSARPPSY